AWMANVEKGSLSPQVSLPGYTRPLTCHEPLTASAGIDSLRRPPTLLSRRPSCRYWWPRNLSSDDSSLQPLALSTGSPVPSHRRESSLAPGEGRGTQTAAPGANGRACHGFAGGVPRLPTTH